VFTRNIVKCLQSGLCNNSRCILLLKNVIFHNNMVTFISRRVTKRVMLHTAEVFSTRWHDKWLRCCKIIHVFEGIRLRIKV
jgi:hypothetical protein